jgi:predicted DNA-binding transcriptional regulator AlpA
MHTQQRETPTSKPSVTADLADLARLTIKDVAILARRSESSLRDMIREGRFPQPDYRDGPRCVRWSAGLVRRWLEATQASSTKTGWAS